MCKSDPIIEEHIFYSYEKNEPLLQHYHNKMLFDSFCEALQYFKPFDIRGKCLDWKVNDKKLTF